MFCFSKYFFFWYIATGKQNVDESVISKPLADYSFRLPGRKNCRAATPTNYAELVYKAGKSSVWLPHGKAARDGPASQQEYN